MENSSEKGIKKGTSRRDFLTAQIKKNKEIVNTLQLEGPIKLGQLELWSLPIEHSRHDWETHQQGIKEAIKQFPIIIPEYFPLEYKYIIDKAILGDILGVMYNDANYLFEEVASFAQQEGKDVWVIDPAYNKEFLLLGGGELATTGAALVGSGAGWDRLRSSERWNKMITRREFLIASGLGLVGLIGVSSALNILKNATGQGYLSGQDFRRVVVAEQLKHLSQSHINGKALLIYPPIHWQVINQYLRDDSGLQKRANVYNRLREIPQFESLFQARHYVPYQKGWKLTQKLSL